MNNSKAIGLDNMPIQVWNFFGDRCIGRLIKLYDKIMRSKNSWMNGEETLQFQFARIRKIYKIV